MDPVSCGPQPKSLMILVAPCDALIDNVIETFGNSVDDDAAQWDSVYLD